MQALVRSNSIHNSVIAQENTPAASVCWQCLDLQSACEMRRVIANLELPYPWAAHQLPKKLDLYRMSPQEFTNAKASYDMLITTVSLFFAIASSAVNSDTGLVETRQGVPGALEPRQIPQTGRGVFVSGAPTPFLVRRCLLEELVPMLDGVFNNTVLDLSLIHI